MGSMGNNWCMMDWFSNIWDCLTLVPDISNEAIVMVSVVGDNLDTTIRKFNSVLSLDNSMFILSLSLGKVSSILISSTILVGKWLGRNLLLMVWGWSWGIWCWGIAHIGWGSQGCGNKGRECKHL